MNLNAISSLFTLSQLTAPSLPQNPIIRKIALIAIPLFVFLGSSVVFFCLKRRWAVHGSSKQERPLPSLSTAVKPACTAADKVTDKAKIEGSLKANSPIFQEASPQTMKDVTEFFQYLQPAERAAIEKYYDHPLQMQILTSIIAGNWEDLAARYHKSDNKRVFYSILDAIFLQKKGSSIDDLVTAYMVLANSDCASKGHCRQITYEEALQSGDWNELKARLPDITGTPKNQRYLFEINLEAMNNSQKSLLKAFLDLTNRDNRALGCFVHCKDKNRILIATAGLMRKDRSLEGTLRFTYRMPKRSTVCRYLLERQEHIISLFHPEDEAKVWIHGCRPKGLLTLVHDGFHTHHRSGSGLMNNKELLAFGLKVSELLKNTPPYTSKKTILSEEQIYRHPSCYAQEKDKVRFFLEETLQHIIDAENIQGSSIEERIKRILSASMQCDFSLVPTITGALSRRFNEIGYEIKSRGIDFSVHKL